MDASGDMEVRGDWDVRGSDVDQQFARFGRAALGDGEIWALSLATLVMPAGSPGCAGYLYRVAGAEGCWPEILCWGLNLGRAIGGARYRAKGGRNRRAYVESYDEPRWGLLAVSDGLRIATLGPREVPAIGTRANMIGCGPQAYGRVRDFVGGALAMCIAEYRCALEWALGMRRDRVFDGRLEVATAEKCHDLKSQGNLGVGEGADFRPLPAGCFRAEPCSTDEAARCPETISPGVSPCRWWRDQPKACQITIKTPPRRLRRDADE